MELLVAGGDKRHELLCEEARGRGWQVMSMGLPGSIARAGAADAAVLPMPYIRDGYIPAPLTGEKIAPIELAPHIKPGARVFCGGADAALYDMAARFNWKVTDLYADEAFARRNALPSAEGAIYAAMRETDSMLSGSECLVIGFGRVGQMLALDLKGLGARVTVAARREASRALAQCMGCEAVSTDALELALGGKRAIFNTVPTRLLGERELMRVRPGALIIETASAPFGVDFEAARALGVRVLKEGGIPGRYCPRTAALIILDAVDAAREAI